MDEMMVTPSFVKRVVRTCLRIGESDKVSIFSWRHTLDLADAFAMECKKAGAHTAVESVSDDVWYDSVISLPLDYLETPNPFSLASATVATAAIFIAGPKNPERQQKVSAERWMALSRADKSYYERILKRKVRAVKLLLGYVTPERAKTYNFNYQAWEKNVEESTDVEYRKMKELGEKLARVLEKSKEVEITNPDGTDLKFTLENRKAYVYDGLIDEEDISRGATFAELPDGAVIVAPSETSAEGVVYSTIPFPNVGRIVESVNLGFKDGKIDSFKGGKNIEVVKSLWEKASGDKDMIGGFSLGLNPKAKLGFLNNQIVLGTASIGIGENREFGGENDSNYGLTVTISQPTVKLDQTVIVKQGRLML